MKHPPIYPPGTIVRSVERGEFGIVVGVASYLNQDRDVLHEVHAIDLYAVTLGGQTLEQAACPDDRAWYSGDDIRPVPPASLPPVQAWDTITVTVVDRDAMARAWGGPGGGGLCLRTLTLPRYTSRGERRSDPWSEPMCEDGEHVGVSRWTLDSGRTETYAEAIAEAAALTPSA